MTARGRIVAWSLAAVAGAAFVPRPEAHVDLGRATVVLGVVLGLCLYLALSGSVTVKVRAPGVAARIA